MNVVAFLLRSLPKLYAPEEQSRAELGGIVACQLKAALALCRLVFSSMLHKIHIGLVPFVRRRLLLGSQRMVFG
jgi:hypothetical protein